MRHVADQPTPALLLDLDVLRENLARMADRCRSLGIALRPHFKTPKCVEVARLQRDLGACGFTVSTLEEARVLLDHGFDDLSWAFPVIPSRVDEARELAERGRLRLTVDTPEAIAALEASGRPFHVWLEVDCGGRRSGVDPRSDRALDLARRLASSRRLTFDGLLTHSGQAYQARGHTELERVLETERRVMVELAERLRSAGIELEGVSIGSTPAMSVAESLPGVTEARPGNYAFHDYTQTVIGACRVADCAVTVLSSVVSCQPDAPHSVLDAGALALSKDAGPEVGCMGRLLDDSRPDTLRWDAKLVSLSQEHGIVDAPLVVGSKVRILPNHSCLTVACWDEYHVVQGDRIVDRWKIWRGR